MFFPVSSSTYAGGSAKVTCSPCSSATFPVKDSSSTNCPTALDTVDIGVRTIDLNKSELGAIFVSVKIRTLHHRTEFKTKREHSPITAGAKALIRIPSGINVRASERTNPTTPYLVAEYIGAMGKGYNPAFEAVQQISPFEPWPCSGVFLDI